MGICLVPISYDACDGGGTRRYLLQRRYQFLREGLTMAAGIVGLQKDVRTEGLAKFGQL